MSAEQRDVCFLHWLCESLSEETIGISHSIYKTDLLDLPADHASSKEGADLAVLSI